MTRRHHNPDGPWDRATAATLGGLGAGVLLGLGVYAARRLSPNTALNAEHRRIVAMGVVAAAAGTAMQFSGNDVAERFGQALIVLGGGATVATETTSILAGTPAPALLPTLPLLPSF